MLALRAIRLRRTWLAAACVIHVVACSDTFESHYASKAEAENAGEIQRGWLPAFLPDRISDIHLMYDLDTNQTWCSFRFSAEDASALRQALTKMTPPEVSSSPIRPAKADWWPQALEGELKPETIEKAGLELYKKNGSTVFAIDWEKGQGFFYYRRH